MKERPILFSAPMVRAILNGSKTQTRRVIKKLPGDDDCELQSPYGVAGSQLWVRETWRIGAWRDDGRMAIDYRASPDLVETPWLTIPEVADPDGEKFQKYWLQCTEDCEKSGIPHDADGQYHWVPGEAPTRWRPSIFMPRWASRIQLEITGVRVERLQDISEDDARAEGVENSLHLHGGRFANENFAHLWEQINGPGSWDANPWVWVIEFKQVKQEQQV